MNKALRKKLIWGALVLLWMGFIFWMSATPGEESNSMSGEVTDLLRRIFFKHWDILTADELAVQKSLLKHLVRKFAHYTEYMILGIFMGGFFSQFKLRYFPRLIFPILIGALYALSDEWHQSFVDGRAMQAFDVFIDSFGVVTGTFIGVGILASVMLFRERRA